MNANDMTFEQYLYQNRISPPPEFSAGVDAACMQILRRDARAAHDRRKKVRRTLRWLAPVAAVIVALAVVFSVPSVSQAVRGWFGSMFRLSDYMAADPEEREDNADIAGAVQTPAPAETAAAIQYLDETEYADGVNQWRVENGYSAFDRANYAWVADLDPQVSELLYDGRNLIVNTLLQASPKRFLGLCGGDGERFDVWTNSVSVTVDGKAYEDYTDQGGGLMLQVYRSDDDSGGYDMDAVNAASSVIEQTTLVGNQSPAFPSGPVTVTIEMWLMDGAIDDLGTVGLVAIITQTLTFDATSGNATLTSASASAHQLSGVAPLTIDAADGSIENRMFDFSIVSVETSVERRATGVNVTLHYAFPSQDESDAYWKSIVPGATGRNGVQYEAIVDGVSIGKVWHNSDYLGLRDDPVLEIPLTESELEGVSSITLRAWVRYISQYSTKGSDYIDMPFDEKLFMVQFSARYEEVALENCDIVIPLN